MDGEQPGCLDDNAYQQGLALRKEVLGSHYVEHSMGDTDAFDADFQDLVVRHVWGTVWARPNLARRDRSLLNLGMLAALNRPEQLAIHLKGALENGLTPAEIKEVFIQVSAYCGVPAAVGCFAVARRVFAELEIDGR